MTAVALAVTASSRTFSVAMRAGDEPPVAAHAGGAGAASDLNAVVAALFDRHGHTPADLAELRLDVGPGSYTGLRVAVTFARTLCAFHAVPVCTTTSLELMALAAWRSGAVAAGVPIRPVLDARRGRFHHARIELRDGATYLPDPPRATPAEELIAGIGAGEAILAAPELHAMLASTVVAARVTGFPPWDATLLFEPRLALREAPVEELEPLYLMGSYAE